MAEDDTQEIPEQPKTSDETVGGLLDHGDYTINPEDIYSGLIPTFGTHGFELR